MAAPETTVEVSPRSARELAECLGAILVAVASSGVAMAAAAFMSAAAPPLGESSPGLLTSTMLKVSATAFLGWAVPTALLRWMWAGFTERVSARLSIAIAWATGAALSGIAAVETQVPEVIWGAGVFGLVLTYVAACVGGPVLEWFRLRERAWTTLLRARLTRNPLYWFALCALLTARGVVWVLVEIGRGVSLVWRALLTLICRLSRLVDEGRAYRCPMPGCGRVLDDPPLLVRADRHGEPFGTFPSLEAPVFACQDQGRYALPTWVSAERLIAADVVSLSVPGCRLQCAQRDSGGRPVRRVLLVSGGPVELARALRGLLESLGDRIDPRYRGFLATASADFAAVTVPPHGFEGDLTSAVSDVRVRLRLVDWKSPAVWAGDYDVVVLAPHRTRHGVGDAVAAAALDRLAQPDPSGTWGAVPPLRPRSFLGRLFGRPRSSAQRSFDRATQPTRMALIGPAPRRSVVRRIAIDRIETPEEVSAFFKEVLT